MTRILITATVADLRAATTPEQLHLASLGLLLQDLVRAYPGLNGSGVLICVEPSAELSICLRTLVPGVRTATESFRAVADFQSVGVVKAVAPIPWQVAQCCHDVAGKHAWIDIAIATNDEFLRVAHELGGIVDRQIAYPPCSGGFAESMASTGEGQAEIPGLRTARGPRTLARGTADQRPM